MQMAIFDQQFMDLFSMELFRQVYYNDGVTLLIFNAFTSLLIQYGIPFDTSYDPGNRKNAPGIELTIFVSPTSKMVINIDLGPGGSEFTTNK